MAAQPPPAEFVKRWTTGAGSTVTLRLQADVRWQPGMPRDLELEEQAEFDAGVIAGMRELALALGVAADPPNGFTIRCAACYAGAATDSPGVTTRATP